VQQSRQAHGRHHPHQQPGGIADLEVASPLPELARGSDQDIHRGGVAELHVGEVDDDARRLEWGSENPDNDYTGWLTVQPDGAGCVVELGLHMQRADEDDSVGTTLANVRRILETGAPG